MPISLGAIDPSTPFFVGSDPVSVLLSLDKLNHGRVENPKGVLPGITVVQLDGNGATDELDRHFVDFDVKRL